MGIEVLVTQAQYESALERWNGDGEFTDWLWQHWRIRVAITDTLRFTGYDNDLLVQFCLTF